MTKSRYKLCPFCGKYGFRESDSFKDFYFCIECDRIVRKVF